LPIIAEKAGTAKFVDLTSGVSVRDETDDATGMTQKIVSDWRTAPKGNELKPEIIIVGDDGEPVRNEQGNPVTYPMSVDAILSVEDGQTIEAGDVVARIPREGAKTKDITGGLPRVAELFEARRPKDHAIIAEIDGYVRNSDATTRTSAGSPSCPPTTASMAGRVHGAQGQAHPRGRGRLRPEGRLHHGRQPRAA
jgi:DNA-directed RNA polymerase subunit beta'